MIGYDSTWLVRICSRVSIKVSKLKEFEKNDGALVKRNVSAIHDYQ